MDNSKEMKKEISRLFECAGRFKKLNIQSMLPEIPRIELHILKGIEHCIDDNNGEKVKVSYVVERTKMPASAVSRALRAIEEKELIVRTVDSKDRRNTFIEMTPKGIKTVEQVDYTMKDFGDAVFERLGEDDIKALTSAFEKLLEIAEEEIEKRSYNKSKGEEKGEI